jgi:hypothetical protein
MLGRIFLGKPIHWLSLALAAAGLWWMGLEKLHVRDFNMFTAGIAAIAIFLIVVVLVTFKPGDRVTRRDSTRSPSRRTEPRSPRSGPP